MTGYIYLGAAFCGGAIWLSNRPCGQKRRQAFGLWAGLLFLGALVLRLWLGYYSEGFSVDMGTFKSWAYSVKQVGFGEIYQQDMFLDYPPGYLYILMLLENIRQLFGLTLEGQTYTVVMKLPSILADLLCGGALLWLGRKKLGDLDALLVSAAYLFCPAVFVNSAQWGQVDSFCTAILLASALLLYGERYVPSALLYGLSIICKPQMLVFAPLYLCFAIKQKKWLQLGAGVGCALGVILLVAAPFTRDFNYWWLVEKYKATMDYYNYYSVNACNFWALIGRNWWGLPEGFSSALLTVAAPLLATAACCVLIFFSKRKDAVFAAPPVLMSIVYLFAVKMHERYLFPALLFVLVSFLFVRDKGLMRAYGFLAGIHYINVSYVLWLFRELGGSYDPNAFASRFISAMQVAAVAYLLWTTYRVYLRGGLQKAGKPGEEEEEEMNQRTVPAEKRKQGKKKGRNARPQSGAPVRAEAVTSLRPPENRKMLRLDWIVMAGITLIYAFVAFWHLGDAKLPVTNWTPAEGESVVLHCEEPANSLAFLPGLAPDAEHYAARVGSSIRVETSEDGVTWTPCGETGNSGVFAWVIKWLDVPGSYVRLTALNDSVTISEAGLLPAGALSAPDITAEGPGAQLLCDEQNTVPAFKTYENSSYFDEIYHARTAYEHILGLEPYENTHPPLGKLIISLGIRIFGMNPFGWRFMGTFFGVLMLPVLYHLCKQLFGKTWLCGLGTFLFAFDFMHFTQTRIATIDTYSVFFLLLMYDAMVCFMYKDIVKDRMRDLLVPLGLSGIFMGLGVASKWTAAYGAVGLAVLFFGKLYSAWRLEVKNRRSTTPVLKRCGLLCAWCCLLFIAIPFGIYFCAFLPITALPHNRQRMLWAFGNYQTTMFNYHSQLEATHDFSSPWYDWPLDVRPIWFFGSDNVNAQGQYSTISSMGNPLLWWSFIPALAFGVWRWVKERGLAWSVAIVGFLAVYMPWVLVPRCTFIYHYFTAVPFLTIALMACFNYFSETGPLSRPLAAEDKGKDGSAAGLGFALNRSQALMAAMVLCCLALFIVYFPVISGAPTTREHVKSLALFSTWYFG